MCADIRKNSGKLLTGYRDQQCGSIRYFDMLIFICMTFGLSDTFSFFIFGSML